MAHDPVVRAKAYPFHIPDGPFVVADGHWRPIDGPLPDALTVDRVPVLACGSNQSPEQLARKFAEPGWAPLVTERVRVRDLDAVYSAHFCRYGAIPATLARAPGAIASLAVTWLDADQLAYMHATEALGVNYDYVSLDGVRVEDGTGRGLGGVQAYVSRHGCLNRDGRPVPLTAVAAEGRLWEAMDETAVLALARDRLAPGADLDAFIAENAANAEVRGARTEALKTDSLFR